MHEERTPFDCALWHASSAAEVPRRVRAALRAVAIFRERHALRAFGPNERRLYALMPSIYANRVEVDAVLDLARRILTDE